MEQNRVMRQQFEEEVKEAETKPNRRIKVRLMPIWLRLLIVIGLIIIAVLSGALLGYSVIGGGHALDVFQKSTWTHIIDIVNKGA
ncbi:DNA-directed RNA polymerase subunit beta [Peribacillus muralis]|uniref:DNA-directed RNA polymerase subunit beta n=1 Tax=Peribacillus muralis TaxID=264697 RepID=UPI00070E0E15|nr:DNA-directed RNA polymerase subunit beta [Peribacillus muralis]MCK1994508.1 DNA-directed RNA polymerase subunit beta [Peribacillus muralis]MCK2015258.1 DNA-directed RNA polymerase subunit beta [Peribacillus muralis]